MSMFLKTPWTVVMAAVDSVIWVISLTVAALCIVKLYVLWSWLAEKLLGTSELCRVYSTAAFWVALMIFLVSLLWRMDDSDVS